MATAVLILMATKARVMRLINASGIRVAAIATFLPRPRFRTRAVKQWYLRPSVRISVDVIGKVLAVLVIREEYPVVI
ncbi:hypothetical protein HY496_02120 [Candidatus Woesearchaeota archaeon]|nr:hypothetical protein [Candidatus Woesearchaeota archaeon]